MQLTKKKNNFYNNQSNSVNFTTRIPVSSESEWVGFFSF